MDRKEFLTFQKVLLVLTLRIVGGVGVFDLPPLTSRVINFVDRLIYVSKGHIPTLGPLAPLLHVEKFVVVGGWWVVEADFSVKLEPQAEQF